MRLILASASPRRRDLLQQIGLAFSVVPADVNETPHKGEQAVPYTLRLAQAKAEAVHALHTDATVIGADTTVTVHGELLGKPRDAADATRMLRLLSGHAHQVITGVAVVDSRRKQTAAETTQVFFAAMTERDIAAYIATGEPMGKAGAYAIQGIAARWIPRIEGDYSNVVGLPLALLSELLNEAGSAQTSWSVPQQVQSG